MAEAPILSTHGCRLNAAETEAIREMTAGQSDLVVVNTCAVTAEAVRKARRDIRRLRRRHPDARLVVTGCAAQIDPASFAAMEEVDRVVGNAEKGEPATWTRLDRAEPVQVQDIMAVTETSPHLAAGYESRTRAHVQIQNGCDHRCTFCVIPYGRGNARSVPAGAVVSRIRELAARGYREVVLTGVDLTSWGQDLPGRPPLGNLVRRILTLVPDLPRLRLSSIDSVEVDPELMEALAHPRLMPPLHLSLQAGHDLTLRRMKRRHLRGDAIRFSEEARRIRPEIVLGADLIAGFPTETEEMFQASLDLVDACGLTWLHVFPYSPRPGTPAARMPQVAGPVVKERAARLRAIGEARARAHLAARARRPVSALMESPHRGRDADFTEVVFAEPQAPGRIVEAVPSGHDGTRLLA